MLPVLRQRGDREGARLDKESRLPVRVEVRHDHRDQRHRSASKKDEIVGDAERRVAELEDQYLDGLITEGERHRNTVEIWTKANDDLTKVIEDNMANYGGIYLMAVSGAKGNIAQIKQMAGMRGLMASSKDTSSTGPSSRASGKGSASSSTSYRHTGRGRACRTRPFGRLTAAI